jgi:hypothetical protein
VRPRLALAAVITCAIALCCPTASRAAFVPLFDPQAEPSPNFFGGQVTLYHTLFRAMRDVQLLRARVFYDPSPTPVIPDFFWQLFESEANGTFLGNEYRLFLAQGQHPSYGLGYYEVDINVLLRAGTYYILSYRANDRHRIPLYFEALQNLPLLTADGNFRVIDGGIGAAWSGPWLTPFELDAAAVPAPPALLLAAVGIACLLGWRVRRRIAWPFPSSTPTLICPLTSSRLTPGRRRRNNVNSRAYLQMVQGAPKMTLSDYLSAARFPHTTQAGLSPREQLLIDAFNHDQLRAYIDEGGTLDDEQRARWAELQEKIQYHPQLLAEVKASEGQPLA